MHNRAGTEILFSHLQYVCLTAAYTRTIISSGGLGSSLSILYTTVGLIQISVLYQIKSMADHDVLYEACVVYNATGETGMGRTDGVSYLLLIY